MSALTPCAEYPRARHNLGYGTVWCRTTKKLVKAHRAAWEAVNGHIPEGMEVCHHCDNPPCCEPSHLFLGTSAENGQDMVNKGRSTYGEKNPRAKLTEADVLEIREMAGSMTQRKIGNLFGINDSTVCMIISGKRWGYLK
jgi:hypothetical protein